LPPVPGIERQMFHAALGELARRHAGAPAPPGPDLTACELGLYSQNGEDGVIAEVLQRVGSGGREFVEFGAERGVEGNCVALADVFAWRGLFIEADQDKSRDLAWKYRDNPRVQTAQARVTAENVDEVLAAHGAAGQPDVMSIDVDGNDVWIWRALTRARPRVLVIEYNVHLDHTRPIAQPYDPLWAWDGTDWFGASLGALELVGHERGYRLVHTELAGVNAFFVRDDLAHCFDDLPSVPRRSPNYDGHGYGHPEHPGGGTWVELTSEKSG
jgi:hypothetical protein